MTEQELLAEIASLKQHVAGLEYMNRELREKNERLIEIMRNI